MQVIEGRGVSEIPRGWFEFGGVVHFRKALENRWKRVPDGDSCVGAWRLEGLELSWWLMTGY